MMENMNNLTDKEYAKKVNENLKRFEKDKTNRIGMMMELEESNNWRKSLVQFNDYLNDNNSPKDRNSLITYIEKIIAL